MNLATKSPGSYRVKPQGVSSDQSTKTRLFVQFLLRYTVHYSQVSENDRPTMVLYSVLFHGIIIKTDVEALLQLTTSTLITYLIFLRYLLCCRLKMENSQLRF